MSEIRPATFARALALADNLRFADVREIDSAWGLGARQGLFHCLLQSDRAYTLSDGGEPEALWGITSFVEDGLHIGVPWMLASERLFRRNRPVLAQSRRVMDQLLLEHDALVNVTDAANESHLRWLEWCGFRESRRLRSSGGPWFVEFQRVNERRRPGGTVETALAARCPRPPRPPDDEVVNALVGMGVAVLGGGDGKPGALAGLPAVVSELTAGERLNGRTGRGCVRLLLEMAVAVTGRASRRGVAADTPLAGLLEAMADVADALALNDGPGDEAVVIELRRVAGTPGRKLDSVRRRPPAPGRPDVLLSVVERFSRLLTVDGRVGRVQGCRLWAAALGVTRADVTEKMPAAMAVLWQGLTEQALVGGLTDGPAAAGAWTMTLDRPVEHRRVLTGLRDAVTAETALGRAVAHHAEHWGRRGGEGPAVVTGEIETLGDAVFAAGAVADRAAADVLPGLRLGGIVSGYRDRHALYRLLRAHLLVTACACEAAEVVGLLEAELAGLLLAARLEDRMLAAPLAPAEAVDLLVRDMEALWPVDAGAPDVPRRLAAVLVPALAVPAVHALQLQPALLAWRLTRARRLAESVGALAAAVEDVAGDAALKSRGRYRRLLRRLSRDMAEDCSAWRERGGA